ncbi:hypothetical protein BDZ89DRAFT_1047780 [Hymenopellis radicata]|nr:hypothetical protein BDZ89DRAFT_1047780 [Hymenopellis radicata]
MESSLPLEESRLPSSPLVRQSHCVVIICEARGIIVGVGVVIKAGVIVETGASGSSWAALRRGALGSSATVIIEEVVAVMYLLGVVEGLVVVEQGLVIVEQGIVVVEQGVVIVEKGVVVVEKGVVIVEQGMVVVEEGVVVVEREYIRTEYRRLTIQYVYARVSLNIQVQDGTSSQPWAHKALLKVGLALNGPAVG